MDVNFANTNSENTASLDQDFFKPIDLNWRKKYYRRVIKKRFFAYLIDTFLTSLLLILICFPISTVLIAFIDGLIEKPSSSDDNFWLIGLIIIFLSTFLTSIVLAILESSRRRATIGKRFLKIEITDEYGNRISFWRSVIRNYLKWMFFMSYFLIIPAIIQIITFWKTKKLFHDQLSGTTIGERLV